MRAPEVIDLNAKLSLFADHWKPRIVSHYNGNEVRIVKVQGDFTWHSHTDTDELFFVLSGELGVEFRDGVRTLKPGELLVVPKGLEHRPFAAKECHVMVMDRDGEPNTGVNPSESTCARLEEI